MTVAVCAGENLGMVLPSTETLLESEFLGELRHNTHFQFLLKAGYEIISNVLLSSFSDAGTYQSDVTSNVVLSG